MSRIKRFFTDKYLWISLLVVIVFFGSLSKLEFSRCTYRMYTADYTAEYEHYYTIGRYIVALAWKAVNVLGFSINQTYFLSYTLAMICITLSIYEMFNISKKLTNNNLLSFIISILIIISPFIIDVLIYLEKGLQVLSICATTYAISNILNYLDTKKKKYLIYTELLLLVSAFSYQGATPIFVCVSLVFILKYSKNIKEFILKNILIAVCFAIPYFFNYACIQLYKTSVRLSEKVNILASIKKVVSLLPDMLIDTYNTMPKYVFILTLALLLGIYVAYEIYVGTKKIKEIENSKSKETIKKENKNKAILNLSINLFGYIYILVLVFFIALAPQLVHRYESIQLVPRSTLCFGAIIGILMLYYFSFNAPNKYLKNTILAISLVYISVEFIWLQTLIKDHYIVNYLDKVTAIQIQNEIDTYEKETGKTIEFVKYYKDANISRTYPNVIGFNEINEKVASMYSRVFLLNYYANRNYIEINEEEIPELTRHFNSIDWDYFDKDQIRFNDNIAYICQF